MGGEASFVSEGDPEHLGRVKNFKTDVKKSAGSIEGRVEIVRKYVSTGKPVCLPEDSYYDLRSSVASIYKIHPSAIIIVGSCRTGFSIARKEYKARYRPFSKDSDIDLAIIHEGMFSSVWESLFVDQPNFEWILAGRNSRPC